MAANFLHKLLNELPEESRWIVMGQLRFKTEAQLYDLILQLEQDILRKVLIKKGANSDEYKFFLKINDAIYQAGEAAYLTETLQNEINSLRQYNDFLQKRLNEVETKLQRFQTIEEMSADGVLGAYIQRVQSIMKESLKSKLEVSAPSIDEKILKTITPRLLKETIAKPSTDGN